MIQLDLFNTAVNEYLPNQSSKPIAIAWSFSKMQSFRNCPRKYYYQYFGSKKRNAKDEILKERLIELSKLSNKYMVQGNLVHQLISIFFKKAKKGESWDYDRLSGFATKIINETIQFNEAIQNGIVVEKTLYPKAILKELYYKTVALDEIKNELLTTVNTCLKNFFESDNYEDLRKGGITDSSKIEGDTSFDIDASLSVDGKVDIAFLNNRLLNIADWKTGKKAIEDTSLQLLVYALWARGLSEWEFDDIKIQKVYLLDGSIEKLEFSEINVDRAKVRIIQDAELLREMDEFGVNAIRDAFAMHIGQNCKSCPFEEICSKKN